MLTDHKYTNRVTNVQSEKVMLEFPKINEVTSRYVYEIQIKHRKLNCQCYDKLLLFTNCILFI